MLEQFQVVLLCYIGYTKRWKKRRLFLNAPLYIITRISEVMIEFFLVAVLKDQFKNLSGDVNSVLSSDEYNELREKFKTQKLPECSKCWEEERNGVKSLREEFNEQYDCNEIILRHLEIGFDNICNLKCDPCWEEWSYQFNGVIKHIKPLNKYTNLEKSYFFRR